MPANTKTSAKSEQPEKKLLTLSAVSKATKISMPTLQRYKKLYQSRIPSVGSGRKQRYPEEALAVFEQLKAENLKRRGRPRKAAAKKTAAKRTAKKSARKTRKKKTAKKATSKKSTVKKKATKKKARRKTAKAKRKTAGRRKAAKRTAKAAPAGLITLSEIGRRTGISYPTLLRYVKVYAAKIPWYGTGRKRRFPEEAVRIFQELRSQSRRGRRKAVDAVVGAADAVRRGSGVDKALARRIKDLEKAHAQISKQLDSVIDLLRRPLKLTIKSR